MNSIKLCAAIGIAGLLAACAQQEEPAVITPEPFYDKYGSDGSGVGGQCVDGYVYVPGSVPEEDRCIPEEEGCEPTIDSTGAPIPCPPPRYPDRTTDRDPGNGRTPSGSGTPPGAGSAATGGRT